MSCAINPFTGREQELGAGLRPAEVTKRVVILGGGPAGMEAARIAAERGHEVALYERETTLGGALRLASTVHRDNQSFLDFLLQELARLPVAVHLGRELRPHQIGELRPDAVIVATGGRLVSPELPGSDLPHVWTGALLRELSTGRGSTEAAARLSHPQRGALRAVGSLQRFATPRRLRALTRFWMPLGHSVVIVGADLAAIELAEFLAERGRRVSVTEAGDAIAPEVGPKRRGEHMDRLDRLGVSVHTGATADHITPAGLVLSGRKLIRADSIILAGELRADTRLYDALKGRFPEVHAIGDCTGLGLIRKATEDAARVASAL